MCRCNEIDEQVKDLLQRLVACPSVNPGRAKGVVSGQGELAMARLLEPLLKSWGAETRMDEWEPGRCNLTATWTGADPARVLLFDAHMDTVGVEGMAVSPFAAMIEGGRLYGRGACDTKGPMVAMLLAIRKVLREEGRLPVTVCFAATGDEEDGAQGAARLAMSGLGVEAAVVAEPTDMKIVYAHKGVCRFRITLTGKAAHSSVPWLGVNAVEAAAELVRLIRREFVAKLQYPRHPELGTATACVSTIAGGTRVNVVPDECGFDVDCRCLPGERKEHMESAMEQLLVSIRSAWPGLQAKCELRQWYPALVGAGSDSFVVRMSEAGASAVGSCPVTTAPYATNGGLYSQSGIPCIVFGPGSISQAHTADEYVELAAVRQAVDVYAAMIRSCGRR